MVAEETETDDVTRKGFEASILTPESLLRYAFGIMYDGKAGRAGTVEDTGFKTFDKGMMTSRLTSVLSIFDGFVERGREEDAEASEEDVRVEAEIRLVPRSLPELCFEESRGEVRDLCEEFRDRGSGVTLRKTPTGFFCSFFIP